MVPPPEQWTSQDPAQDTAEEALRSRLASRPSRWATVCPASHCVTRGPFVAVLLGDG